MTGETNTELRQVRFQNAQLNALGIEPLSVASIRMKLNPDLIGRAERVGLYVLIFVSSGRGYHTVDFQRYSVAEGSIVFVRPGQVQQWSGDDTYRADCLLIDPAALPSTDVWQVMADRDQVSVLEWQTCLLLRGEEKSRIAADIKRFQHDFSQYDGSDLDNVLLRSQLKVILMRLARCQRNVYVKEQRQSGKKHRAFIDFLHELETSFATEHAVKYYVKRLGYSESSLNRACRSASGYGAKAAIDNRLALEAQRLLVHSQYSIAEISHRLGFSEATNSSKFFKRKIGSTPAGFRDDCAWRQLTSDNRK